MSMRQHFFEDHQVVPAIGVPTNADDVVTKRNRQMEHWAMLIVALEADRFVLVLPGPAMHGIHELAGDALPAALLQHAIEPGEEHGRLQLEAHEKTDGALLDLGDEHQHIVAPAKATPE